MHTSLRDAVVAVALATTSLAGAAVSDLAAQAPEDSLATLRGRVVSGMTGGPLPEARVVLEKSGRGAYTDSTGRFVIPELPPGQDTVRVQLIGFADHQVPLQLRAGRVTSATFMLSRSVLKIEELTVEVEREARVPKLAGFRDRMRQGQGVFVDPQEIADRNVRAAAELLRGKPGVSVGPAVTGNTPIRISRYNRHCRPFIWLDGTPARGMHIDMLSPEDILAMELYRGPAETPPQFQFRQGTCATLVVWTRTGSSSARRP